jgi:hypothetical protein
MKTSGGFAVSSRPDISVRPAARRWQRGIARALLLAGALAGMTLGTVAHAQIVARTPAQSAGQAAPLAPTFKSFVATLAAAATGGADPTVTLPAHAADDILLLATIVRSNTATVATPAGWTQIGSPTVRAAVATYQFFWKRAASGAETNPLIDRTGTTGDVYAAVIVYQGAIATGDPWEVKGAVVTGTTDPSVITGITTLTANSLVVVAVAGENDNNASIIATGTNPAAYTEHYIESATGANGVITFSEFVRTTAGATGNVSVDWNTAVPIGFGGIVLALRPPVAAITIALPAGTVANDVMVASISFRLNSPGVDSRDIAITPPAGWALVGPTGRMDNLNSTGSGLAVYSKVSAGEAGPYTWNFSCINVSGSNTCVTLGFSAAAGGIVSFSGVDTTTPIDVESGAPTAAATTTPATPNPGPTTTVANTMLVTSHAIPNANTWQISPPSGMTQAFQRTSVAEMIQVSTALQPAAGATGPKTATDLGPDAADFGNAHILALRPLLPLFNQSAYRLFNNANSTDVGTALAALNTAATLGTTGAAFRLRMLLHVSNANLAISGQAFKLQFAARSGTCDTAFSGEAYADVTAASVIAYNNNATPADGATLTANAGDPTHGADTVVNQTYEELNNFTNSTAAINIGQDGKWDFSLVDNGAPANTPYCFRVVKDTGTVLDTYTVIPEITTAPRGTIFYFHDAATPDTGTLPGATTLSATAPNVTAATAGTNRDMDQTAGTAQVSQGLTTNASAALQRNWFRRFLSRPLAAQTLPTGIWQIQGAVSESNLASNMFPWGAVIKVWRPSTGTTVATLLDDPVLGISANEPTVINTETNASTLTPSITGVAVNDGDILVVELWAENTQGSATGYTNTIFYDGTTEGSAASNAAFLQAPGAITFYRSLRQSAYRLFNNADSTDVGTTLAAQDTAATLGSTGAAFRLRLLLHVADINLGISGQAFKLQFAARSGTCDTAFSGEAYADVTAATVIAYNNNATPADEANLTNNANDPTHSGHTLRNQTYQELNNFTNSALAINSGEDGKWDFALKDNGAPASTAYCFRAVKSTGTVLDTYIVIPEITTTASVPTPGSFNAFETSTAGGAITGVIRTKVAGSAFSLDVVAIAAGVQQAGFTDAVIVELRGNNTLGVSLDAQNCPTSSTLVQTVSPNPTITGGRSTVNFAAVAESWRDVRVRVRWPAASPTVTWCSTDNFAIRPNTLASFAVTDTDWQTTGTPGARALNLLTFAATTPIHKAGRPFSVRATAVNAVAATTTNYVGAPTATLSTCGSAACTATFGTLTLTTTFVAGQLASDVASYNDVGSFWLQLVDSTFASVDAADTTGDCTGSGRYVCSATINVGRFVPDHLAVSLNTPVFGTDCGSFTYIGRAFNYTTPPVITVTGQDFSNNPTALYTGTWFRISNSSLTGKSYTWATGTLDTSGITGTDPVINSAARTLTFSSGTGVLFTRTTPVAPFDAEISLAINVIDDDTVAYATNPARFGTATAGNGINFSAGKPMRFGRLAIRNANGSQLVPLPVQVEAQYWSGAPTNAFITNTQDSCTSIATNNEAMGGFTNNLAACETAITAVSAFSNGRSRLMLAAPGSGNNGSVDLTVNLSAATSGTTCTTVGGATVPATGANRTYLQGNWTGVNYDQNPTARATFGVFKGAEEVVFVRENF